MIDLHYAPTPNGWKISIMLEELGIPYTVFPVDIRAGDQFKPDFLAISPNNRIPAIVDHAPPDGGYSIHTLRKPTLLQWVSRIRALGHQVLPQSKQVTLMTHIFRRAD